ncbi:MAG: hypothetical protein HYU54_06715 [Actinobacteria bacterium]|nr:hypothetical protein [Actinomycetota bacterium]
MARATERDGTGAIARSAIATAMGFAIGGAAILVGAGAARAVVWVAAAGALGGVALALGLRDGRDAVPLALGGAPGMFTGASLAFITLSEDPVDAHGPGLA